MQTLKVAAWIVGGAVLSLGFAMYGFVLYLVYSGFHPAG